VPKDARSRLVALDKRRVWHPYTPMGAYRDGPDPLVIVHAEGSRLFDADGRSYLDGNASWWSSTLGHAHPRLLAALKRQADALAHVALAGITHEPAALLADALCRVAPPGLEHVFYSDDGSTAVEVALKLALQYWAQNGRPRRRRFVALADAFHGETLGATAIGGVEAFRKPFTGALLDAFFVTPPREPGSLPRAIEQLGSLLDERADEIAAVVLEPVLQGAAGMRKYDPAFLRAARELCDRDGTFLVFDEVFTGYGRTGPMWAAQHAGVSPDILCTAKGFTAGLLPMGATLTSARVFEGFLGDPSRAFYYGHTFCGHPLGAAVALEVLRVFEDEKILELARPKAARIAAAFDAMRGLPGVAAVRSLGMASALDLAGEGGYLVRTGWRVYEEALRRGAYLRPLGNVVYVTPSLNIPDSDLDRLLAIVHDSVEAATRGS
jgi:adenosylmethionine-8-amino-7-oxononanoate aminotransferase